MSMKMSKKSGLHLFLWVFLSPILFFSLQAQDGKKNTVRIKADYTKVMDGQSYLDIKGYFTEG